MGPRPLGRGRVCMSFPCSFPASGVNGAATSRPRKGHGRGGRGGHCGRVNGAATSRPRKDPISDHLRINATLRQWGRDLSAAEGSKLAGAINECIERQWGRDLSAAEGCLRPHAKPMPLASMGPRPLGRGRCWRSLRGRRACLASMGPRPLGRGRHAADHYHRHDESASMGPRPLGRGRTTGIASICVAMPRQWGRDLSAAEGALGPHPRAR